MTQDLHRVMQNCHERIWQRFVHPEFGLIYDYVGPNDDGRQPFWWLPTADEVSRHYPNPQGWSTGMEDSTLSGGVYLAAMLSAYRTTARPEYAEKACRLYRGLMRTATCSPEKGFIARGVSYDGTYWYAASSVDQYTWWAHGMWLYAHSELASPDQKEAIGRILHEVCTRLQRYDWMINRDDGQPSYYTDIGAFTADRTSRLLEVLLIAHDITGHQEWYDIYRQKLEEENYRRLDAIQDALAASATPYVIIQTAASLLPLISLESDEVIRQRYINALITCARGMWYAVPSCYRYEQAEVDKADWDPDWRKRYPPEGFHKGGIRFEPPGWKFEDAVIRRPCEAMMVVLYAADADPAMAHGVIREQLSHIMSWALSTYDYDHLHSYAVVYAESLYWLAQEKQLLGASKA